MTGAVVLAAYVLAAGFGATIGLSRGWARRSPRMAMILWLALAASWLTAVALAGLAITVPLALTWQPGGAQAASHLPGLPGSVAAAAVGLLAAAVIVRAAWHIACGLILVRREHRALSAFLSAAGRPDTALGAVVLDGDAPAAYCLPRGRHRVAVSAGTVSRLGSGPLQAVLAHERAHLRGHHHLLLVLASALARAFPAVPLFARGAGELAVLAEMAADDAAARHHDAADLAAALVILASGAALAPGGTALTAGGTAAVARMRRLLAPPPRARLLARTVRLAAGLAALAIPAAVIGLPLVMAACDAMART